MDRISAPPQNALLGRLADLLRLAETGAAGGPEFLPKSLDVMNLVRQLALPSAETVEKLSYGDPLFRMAPSGTGSRIPMTADREYLADVAGMVPFAAPAARPSARGMQDLVRQIQTEPPVGAISPEIAARVIPNTKVVDEAGNPKLLYHGTIENFDEFSPGTRGAIFATPDPNFTKMYAGETLGGYVEGGNVRPVYVDAKNPFDYENPKHINSIVKWIKENNPDFQDIAESIGDKVKDGFYYTIERPIVQDAIRNLGFDGFYVSEGGVKNIAVFNPRQIKSATSDPQMAGLLGKPAQTLDTLNPTGSIFTKYDPSVRASAEISPKLTTYNLTAGLRPDDFVTVYRGVPSGVKSINAGDFVTTNKQLAKDYAGKGAVISKKVRAKDLLDDADEPMGGEYIYRPNKPKK